MSWKRWPSACSTRPSASADPPGPAPPVAAASRPTCKVLAGRHSEHLQTRPIRICVNDRTPGGSVKLLAPRILESFPLFPMVGFAWSCTAEALVHIGQAIGEYRSRPVYAGRGLRHPSSSHASLRDATLQPPWYGSAGGTGSTIGDPRQEAGRPQARPMDPLGRSRRYSSASESSGPILLRRELDRFAQLGSRATRSRWSMPVVTFQG